MSLSKREQDKLVSDHFTYARKKASIFHAARPWLERDDLTQEALIAMMVAAETYDPSFGTTFVTYATKRIDQRFLFYARTQRREAERVDRAAWHINQPQDRPIEDAIDAARETSAFESSLPQYPNVQRFLMGHSMTDIGKSEAVATSTISRRLAKEKQDFAALMEAEKGGK